MSFTEEQLKEQDKTLIEIFKEFNGIKTDEESNYINSVLKEVRERSNGTAHASFDYSVLIKNFHDGVPASKIVDDFFAFIDKLESGEIKTKPWTEEFSNEWCGPNCECYPDPATETEEDKALRLERSAKADEIISRHLANVKL